MMLSVIIVASNEEEYIHSIIREVEQQKGEIQYEILLADGASIDDTLKLAKAKGIKIVNCRKGKAMQMNDAAKVAKGDVLFFVHADMKLPRTTLNTIVEKIKEGYDGGGFANVFDEHNDKIKRLGTWMNFRFLDNREQSDKGIFYGDNGIFVKRSVFEMLRGFKEIALMEDYDFSCRMRAEYKVIKIKNPPIVVSARRHIKTGFLKTRFQWIMIRCLYNWGVAPERLANWYKDVR